MSRPTCPICGEPVPAPDALCDTCIEDILPLMALDRWRPNLTVLKGGKS